MIPPQIAAPKAATKTPAAATSLVLPARGWYSGDTRSVRYSKAVFKASAARTNEIERTRTHHSSAEILKNKRIEDIANQPQ